MHELATQSQLTRYRVEVRVWNGKRRGRLWVVGMPSQQSLGRIMARFDVSQNVARYSQGNLSNICCSPPVTIASNIYQGINSTCYHITILPDRQGGGKPPRRARAFLVRNSCTAVYD